LADYYNTESIKFIGSKQKLLPFIDECVKDLNDVRVVLDGFSGSSRVSQFFAKKGYSVIANDISDWSDVLNRCYLKSEKSDAFYQEILDYLNGLKGYHGWFSENYGGNESDKKKPFLLKNTMKLDAIRDALDKMDLEWNDKSVLLTSLLLALDKVDSTLGHYVSYLGNWSKRAYGDLFLKLPKRFQTLQERHRVFKMDIFDLLDVMKCDLAYFDPPYVPNNKKVPASRVRYNAYYHFLTSVIRNDKPEVFGKAKRRIDSKDNFVYNPFEDFKRDEKGKPFVYFTLQNLLEKTKSKYILLSYSSNCIVSKTDLLEIFTNLHFSVMKVLQIDYKRNVMASMIKTGEWLNDLEKHQEYLFLLKK
jgi:adenine-specific DNA-methyltransferase